ncbi:HlyD family secretion protein [Winogradskyella luteola]|uniref:HlyD family efflux transporter periplasmic adaptor subunit n=1 Tax=Winogradskyella luteola TaxID=2828330 RepID=A0A9X1JPG7_9FLAO|nr:HlyD family efflux transporter periplasmic adaptor subunit [Winogradskyella luteola]MBV7270715.1 HlyD family efflux transporter periplasmic adaptor subunit [Winogradskyella luteola]
MPKSTLNIELRSEQVQEILTAVPNWMIRYGNTLVLILILMLLFISWFVKYPDIISSKALITTGLSPQKEYARISGNIDTLFVKDNELVQKGTALAIIENTANPEDVFFLKSIIDTIKLNKENFKYPLEDMPILFLGSLETDYALFENNYIQYQLNKQLQPYASERLANNSSLSELQLRLKTLQSQKHLNKSEMVFQKNDLERHRQLFEKGVISKQNYESKQLSYFQAERNFANIDASISQIREAISTANSNAVNTSINKTKEDISLFKNVIQSFNQLKRALKDWEMNYVLSSDIEGTVSFLNVWNANQSVNQGDLVFTIIPKNNKSYLAKLKTPANNSGKLKNGQTVYIKLENYPETEFGTLKGKISSISMVPDEEGFYLIDVLLPKNKLITTYNKEIIFKYEMRGQAEIVTEDLRLIERFFYQLKNVFKN